MVKLLSIYGTGPSMEAHITSPSSLDGVLKIRLNSILSRPAQDIDEPVEQFRLVNEYLDWKGDRVKERLYDVLATALQEISDGGVDSDNRLKFLQNVMENLLDSNDPVLDITDMYNWLVTIKKFKAPMSLAISFDETYETDGHGSRNQTYIQDDYIWLVALIMWLKVGLLPFFYFATQIGSRKIIKNSSSALSEYLYFIALKGDNHVWTSKPFEKLRTYINSVIDAPNTSKNVVIRNDAIQAISLSTDISKSDVPYHLLAKAMFAKLFTNKLTSGLGRDEKNPVTTLYGMINSSLGAQSSELNNIRNKKPGGFSPEEITASVLDDIRKPINVTEGDKIEFNNIFKKDTLLKQMRISIDPENIKPGYEYIPKEYFDKASHVVDLILQKQYLIDCTVQLVLLKNVYKNVIDPRTFDYLTLESIATAIQIAFGFLWFHDHKLIACLLTSKPIPSGDEIVFSPSNGRDRITENERNALLNLFPIEKMTETIDTTGIEEYLHEMADKISGINWLPVIDSKYLKSEKISVGVYLVMPTNIKSVLAQYIIFIENRRSTNDRSI